MNSVYRTRKTIRFAGELPAAVFFAALILLQAVVAFSDVEMTGFRIVQETENGRWEIQAGRAYYDGKGDVNLQEVSARMTKNGIESVSVSSDKGRYETEKMILQLEGNVLVSSSSGVRFKTPRLSWNGPQALMLAERGVEVERGVLSVVGRSIRYTVDTGTALVSGGVKTTWNERRTP